MILRALEISLIITAIYVSMRDGMIFEQLRAKLDKVMDKLPDNGGEWVKKPIYDCLICMGFWWGVLIYFLMFRYDAMMLPTVLVVMGVNTLIDKIIHFEV